MRERQVNTGWKDWKKKKRPAKRKSFLKKTICKTRSLKPDYRPTMTQSLMFIPVIRCEEEDLYFIVVECIKAAFCLLLCLPASLGTIFLLLRPGVIPAWRKARCLQPTYNGSSITSDATGGKITSIQSKAFSLHWLTACTERCLVWVAARWISPWFLSVSPGLRWIAMDCLNCL